MIKKWELIAKKDVSPHTWFPIEMRTYKLPDGKIVEDFSVTVLRDVSMIVPVTKDKKVVLVKQFKPGVDEVLLEFPAGRLESNQDDFLELAKRELEEEVGIRVAREQLKEFAVLAGFTTKGSERVHFFFVSGVEFNAKQKLDETEGIEIVTMDFQEMEQAVVDGTIWAAQTIAGWELAKKRFKTILSTPGVDKK